MADASSLIENYPELPENDSMLLADAGEAIRLLRVATQNASWRDVHRRAVHALGLGIGTLAALTARDVRGREGALAPRELDTTDILADAVGLPAVQPVHEVAIAACVRGLIGLIHYEFNAAANSLALQEQQDAVAVWGKDSALALQHSLAGWQRALQAAVADGEDIAETATALVGQLQERLPSFAIGLARLALLATQQREAGKGQAAEKTGQIAAQSTLVLRHCITSYAAALRLAAEATASPSRDLRDLMGRVDQLSFSAPLENGKDVELHKLHDVDDDSLVEVRGFATSFAVAQTDKLLGHVELTDPSSGATGWVTMRFVHPAHAGISQGAFVNATGTYRASSSLRENEATVEVRTMAPKKLADRAWTFAMQRLARSWYVPWPNQCQIYWSMGSHGAVPEDNDNTFTQGAAELIYPPFLRSKR